MKGISLFSKYILFILGIISLMPGMAYSQTFKHYEGIANKTGDYEVIDASTDCLRQKTHVVHYYIALPSGGSKELSLPFSGYSGDGADLEPRGYFRWYNYDTDKASAQLKAYSAASTLLQRMNDTHGIDKGLIAYNLSSKPNSKKVGVVYTRPSDTSWTGETIACDVSRYMDGCNGTFYNEPTLSIRYIFHIMPAEKMADDIKKKLLETGRDRDYTYEDGKGVSAGLKDASASMTLRLNQNDVTNYYFHPMNNINTHHVFAEDEAHKIKESDFSSQVVQASYVQWRVYNSDKSQFVWWTYRGSSSARFFDLSLDLLNNKAATSAWRNLNGGGVSSKQTFKYGDRIYVVAIAGSSSGMCPIANFTCQLFNQYPMTTDELKTAGQNTRLNSYLDDHYRSVNTVSFDNDADELTLQAPTSPDDNQDRLPSKWSRRSYGFVYRELMNSAPAGTMYVNPKHSPLHGEYGLYKSANIKGKSGWGNSGTDSYLWWPTAQLYDRTYENTNGTQYGHFLYIDASDESRQIAEADFKADLCVGSQVIFSAAIADMTTGSQRPQLMFKLYGVNYNENNQETERRLLHSFSSGNFSGNRVGDDGANVGKWYQVYGKMVLQKESGVNNFTDFKLVVDNMCKSTQGADYAFDDLRIYTKASKVDVIQSSPICPDKNTAEDSSVSTTILLKLRALQETMAALADNTEKKLYFRFVDADGSPVTNVNYGTAESPNYNWGTTTIYNYVDENRKVDEKPMYEKINDEWNVVLANRYFNLQSNQTYYVSFAFEDENQLSWGKPSDVCSLYSANFQMVQQKVLVTDANGSITTTVTIPCDDNGKPEYHIKAQLQTVDQNNGGSIQLNGVRYNWYVDDAKTPILENSAEFSNIPLSVGDHTIRVFPTKTSGTITQGGVDYQICLGEMSFKLRVVKNGPQLSLGVPGVAYPNNYVRTVRIGLPQVALLAQQEAKKGKGGYFCIPVSGKNFVADNSNRLYFVVAGGKDKLDPSQYTNVMYLSDTNDPAYKNRIGESLTLATLQDHYIERNTSQLKLKFTPQSGDASSASKNVQLREGYWYEGVLIFREDGHKGTTVLCSGETYIRFAVVPEYATWNPTANSKMSAAWNNDDNWRRSDHGELYKGADKYTDYSSGGYVPMKFTKVTIPDLSGLYFPSLGYIAYQKSTGIATKLSNAKGDAATTNIQYDMLAQWNANTESHGLNADGNLECEPFYGNTCDQIYFKPGGELLNQCYLIYNKAWVEKQMKPNIWYALTSPLLDTYAGDIYVPAASGRQETEAFEPILFSSSVNNRVTSPVYQRSWDDASAEEVILGGNYDAYDYAGTGITFEKQNLNALSAHWSHVYNKVDRKYHPLEGVAIKMGDKYTVGDAGTSASTSDMLLRLPKADTQYTYVSASQQQSSLSASVDKTDAYRLVVNADAQENALGKMNYKLVQLQDGNNYYLVGNPYMATLSMYKFLKANPSLQSSFYVYEDGALKLYNKLDMSTTTYESKNDVKISPMQSFFVRLNDGQSASQLNFTSAMTVDREVFGGVKTASDEGQDQVSLTLTAASASGYSSRSKVVLDANASEDYDEAEDAQLLYDAQLKEVPVVYTVAGDEAVALNSLPSIDWMPLGVVGASSDVESGDVGSSANSASVLLAIAGISRLSSPLYLYDAATRKYQEIKDGEEVKVQANEHGRYFLTQTRSTTGIEDAEVDESDVKIYSPSRGLIVVSKVSAPLLNKVEVYTLDGRLVASRKAEGAASVSIPVVSTASPQEVYIIKVSMLDTQATITRKLSLH
ncbi:T9SS type A sorting domain-containing protein [Segatella copri]|uniref:T9SS type A sorting domain-containing protein n=1 Tax=Segatella copri TaxID=165179 RepID=UPI003F8BCD36